MPSDDTPAFPAWSAAELPPDDSFQPGRLQGRVKVCIFADFPLGALEGEAQGRGAGQLSTWFPQLASAFELYPELEIHWCILDKGVKRRTEIRRWNQVFHILPGGRITTGLLSGRWLPRRAFRRVLLDVRPDVIHCWGTEKMYSAALWEFKGPRILSMQGILSTIWRTGGLTGWRWRLLKAWEPPAIRRARVVTTESEWGGARIREIAPGVETRRIEYGVANSFYDVPWRPDPQIPRILFAGTLSVIKGFDILLEMLVRHPSLPWRLVVAGEGPFGPALRELRHPCVDCLGVVTTQRLQVEMSRAWALVLPSRADTSPNVVKEARVIGLPVVVSPHGGHFEYVQDGVDGRVVSTPDPEDWLNALDWMCRDLERVVAMGRARHDYFREHFRPEHTASAFMRLYRDVRLG